ncbi:MFS transporter [Novosphingobium huizhouense]|uniref:MFS transporter n=1 Tax=Novosphingobium huizhouense TaxID=2866625 RepID=UPI001CD8F51E|nr:MFS transporter [Novosphingobium huizhouense]
MLRPQARISEAEREAGLARIAYEAAFANTTAALTTGVVLTAFALHLGAGNALIGLLASLPFLAQLAQIPAITLVERLRRRKAIAVWSSVIGRSMLGAMALLPFAGAAAPALLVAMTLVLCLLAAIGGCAWNSWMRDFTPEDRMGAVFARRTTWATITTIVAGLGAAALLQYTAPGSRARDGAFAALYAVGCLAGLASAAIVARIPEPVMAQAGQVTARLGDLLREPLADANFARLLAFLASWQFAVNLATPFFTVFLVDQLGYRMTTVMGLSIASQLANALALRNWGALTDRFSNKSVLLVAAPVYIGCIAGMAVASQITGAAARIGFLVGLHVLMGASVAGVTLATTNIGLKLSPRGMAASYVAASGVTTALAAGLAPIVGGLFAEFFAGRRLEVIVRWTNPEGVLSLLPLRLGHWDFYFLISGLLGLHALHRLSLVREEGEIGQRDMVRHVLIQARSSVHAFSTVTGFRALTEIPGNIVREVRVRRRFARRHERRAALPVPPIAARGPSR